MCMTTRTGKAKNCYYFSYTSLKPAINLFSPGTIKNKGSKQTARPNYFTADLQAFFTKEKQEISHA